jgi:hypothetical protein
MINQSEAVHVIEMHEHYVGRHLISSQSCFKLVAVITRVSGPLFPPSPLPRTLCVTVGEGVEEIEPDTQVISPYTAPDWFLR